MKRLVLLNLIAVFILAWTLPAAAEKLNDIQRDKRRIDSEISKIQSKKREVRDETKKLETQKNNLLNDQTKENKEYQQLLLEVNAIEAEIKNIEDTIKEAEENYNEQKELVKIRLRVMYENSNISMLETLIRSKSLTDFFERLELISLISKKEKELVESLKAARMDVEYKRQRREEDKRQMLSRAGEKRERLNGLKISRAGLDERIRKSQTELAALEDREDELYRKSREMEDIIKNLSKKKNRYIGGNMIWPVPGSSGVSSGYGMRKHPVLKKYKMHTGIDISADTGASIVAANKGTVILSGYVNGYGNTVIIDHGGGITTLYAHNSKSLVKVGDEVASGQMIAKVGRSGLATGPNLHFEVRKDGKPRDPLQDLGK